MRQFFVVILNLLVQFTVLFFLFSLLVLVFHLILLFSCKYFACFICFFSVCRIALAQFCSFFLPSLCIYLMFVLQFRFSLFQIVCHHFVSVVERLDSIKLFTRKIKACKGRVFTSLLKDCYPVCPQFYKKFNLFGTWRET